MTSIIGNLWILLQTNARYIMYICDANVYVFIRYPLTYNLRDQFENPWPSKIATWWLIKYYLNKAFFSLEMKLAHIWQNESLLLTESRSIGIDDPKRIFTRIIRLLEVEKILSFFLSLSLSRSFFLSFERFDLLKIYGQERVHIQATY